MKCNFCAALLHFISKRMNSACYFGENNFIPFFSLFVFTALILQGFKLAFERNTFEARKQFCCWLPSDLPFRQFSGKSFYFLQIKTCCFPEHVPALSTKQGKGMLNNSPIFSTLSPPTLLLSPLPSKKLLQQQLEGAGGKKGGGNMSCFHTAPVISSSRVTENKSKFLKAAHIIRSIWLYFTRLNLLSLPLPCAIKIGIKNYIQGT